METILSITVLVLMILSVIWTIAGALQIHLLLGGIVTTVWFLVIAYIVGEMK